MKTEKTGYVVLSRLTNASDPAVHVGCLSRSETQCHDFELSLWLMEAGVAFRRQHFTKIRARKRFFLLALTLIAVQHQLSSRRVRPEPPLIPPERFNFQNMNEGDELRYFRFTQEEIRDLIIRFRLPDVMKTPERDRFFHYEGLCILLYRLHYPSRYSDMVKIFGRASGPLCRIANDMLDRLYDNYAHLLGFDFVRLTPALLRFFAQVIHNKGSPYTTVFAFVDGTLRKCCRPIVFQDSLYNGWKKIHCIKFLSIVTPDGIIITLIGPWAGIAHDARMWAESGVEDVLRAFCVTDDGVQLALFGDAAFPRSICMLGPFEGVVDVWRTAMNRQMSSLRESVEWMFNRVLQLFTYLDFSRNLKVLLSPIAKSYMVGALFTNIRTCMDGGNIVSDYFNCDPPELGEYLHV